MGHVAICESHTALERHTYPMTVSAFADVGGSSRAMRQTYDGAARMWVNGGRGWRAERHKREARG